jgi:guanyl-specific ribonuclease Sa
LFSTDCQQYHQRHLKMRPMKVDIMVHASTIMRTSVATALAAIAVWSAAPATADEDEYLKLRDSYPTLSAEQLLAEGQRVCVVAKQGVPSPVSVGMVTNDLGVSTTAALTIVSAAIMNLDC